MTGEEFAQWFKFHAAAYPELLTWFNRLPVEPGPGGPSQGEVMELWRQTLEPIELETAQEASRRIYQGQEPEPRGFGRHAAAVAQVARRVRREREPEGPRPVWVDGERAYRCVLCEDTGRVICWHPLSVAIAAGRPPAGYENLSLGDRFTLYTCAVACDCQSGERFGYLPRYQDGRWLVCPMRLADPDSLEELRRFATGRTNRVERTLPTRT